jgi:hypothetical protein
MQTFLPFPSLSGSARVLDSRRLGKQRLEALTILRVLGGEIRGWRSHPAVLMWARHRRALARYGVEICREWKRRGFQDQLEAEFRRRVHRIPLERSLRLPPWFGSPALHASHRSNLLRKDPLWYGRYGWTEGTGLPYVWPVRSERLPEGRKSPIGSRPLLRGREAHQTSSSPVSLERRKGRQQGQRRSRRGDARLPEVPSRPRRSLRGSSPLPGPGNAGPVEEPDDRSVRSPPRRALPARPGRALRPPAGPVRPRSRP